MTFSIKKIFSKKDDSSQEVETKKSISNEKSDNTSEKKPKHDTPSGCCGSCS